MYSLERDLNDDPAFLGVVARLITGTVRTESVRRFVVIKIDNWFGSNWLGFRYKILGAAGAHEWDTANPELVPPFIPKRIVKQHTFELPGDSQEIRRVHRYQPSEHNRRNRLEKLVPGTALFWWSGGSALNGRGSVMAYLPGETGYRGWYAGFKRVESRRGVIHQTDWGPAELKGTSRRELSELLARAA